MQDGHLFHTRKGKAVDVPVALAPLADTHGHLTSFRKLDASEAIARAALAGVRMLCVPVDPSDDVQDVPAFLSWLDRTVDQAAQLLDAYAAKGLVPPSFAGFEDVPALVDNVRFVAGVHPYGSQRLAEDPRVRERLTALLQDARCVGVGEFGLDFGPWNTLPASVQEQAFRLQLRMAHEVGLPVELHLRDAQDDEEALGHQDALRILEEEGVPAAGCDLHCFTSGPEAMRPFVERGCHVAFGGASTFGRSDDIREAAAACPEHLLLSETDCPYMAPMPLRGMECEPAMIAFTVAHLAEVRSAALGVSARQTYEALWHNACSFFGVS